VPLWGLAIVLSALTIVVQQVFSATARQTAARVFRTDFWPAVQGLIFMLVLYSLAWYAVLRVWLWLR
jgi:hypothetical protein